MTPVLGADEADYPSADLSDTVIVNGRTSGDETSDHT